MPFITESERNRWLQLLPRLKKEPAQKLLEFLEVSNKQYDTLIIKFNTKSINLRAKLENKALAVAEYGQSKADKDAVAKALSEIENL